MTSIIKWAGAPAVCSSGISVEFDFVDFRLKFIILFLGAVFNPHLFSHVTLLRDRQRSVHSWILANSRSDVTEKETPGLRK
jgi:hypothetical protein